MSSPYCNWKGKTFQEITTHLQRNAGSRPDHPDNTHLFLPNPLKIYRRESSFQPCSPRTSSTIDEFNRPNGSCLRNAPEGGGTFDAQLIKPNLSPENNAADACHAAARSRSSSGILRSNYCTSSRGVTDRRTKRAGAETPVNLPYKETSRGSGTHVNQKKYDTLTDGGMRLRTIQGTPLSHSMAYNVPVGGYTKKAWNQPFPNACVRK